MSECADPNGLVLVGPDVSEESCLLACQQAVLEAGADRACIFRAGNSASGGDGLDNFCNVNDPAGVNPDATLDNCTAVCDFEQVGCS